MNHPAYSTSSHTSRRHRRRPSVFRLPLLLAFLICCAYLLFSAARGLPGQDAAAEKPQTSIGNDLQLQMTQADLSCGDLALVNQAHPLSHLPEIQLTQLKNGQSVDSRCYPPLQEMMDDCRSAGLSPLICSSYRSQETQKRLHNEKVSSYIEQGYTRDKALELALRSVAAPGTSEHQLGLAVDICAMENQNLDSSQADTPVQQWLMEHSWEYGFVLRYDEAKSDLTGIIYEPWHYRYVGQPHAAYMTQNGLCLEEYITFLQGYPYDGQHLFIEDGTGSYEIYYCQGLQPYVPTDAAYSISGDNIGGFIVTIER